MNKSVFLLLMIIFFGCSSSDDSQNNSSALNPPAWIQGKWTMGEGDAQSGYEFKSNDWCITGTGLSTCWKSTLENSNGQFTADETIKDNSYTTKFNVGGATQTYTFIKMSATQIKGSSPMGSSIYTKE